MEEVVSELNIVNELINQVGIELKKRSKSWLQLKNSTFDISL